MNLTKISSIEEQKEDIILQQRIKENNWLTEQVEGTEQCGGKSVMYWDILLDFLKSW